ncbi:MAG: AAA family ATPase, partial [Bacteroidetes bacterium QH_1_64_81]
MSDPESAPPESAPPAESPADASPDPSALDQSASPPLDPYTAHYPSWAQELARKYFTKTVATFILHGDIRDVVPAEDRDGNRIYPSLRTFLIDDLFAARDVIIFYDRSAGIHFADDASRTDFSRALAGQDTLAGTEYEGSLPKAPDKVFELLEEYFRLRLSDGTRVACIIDYAETVAPMAEASMYSAQDRQALVYLQKWSRDSLFLESDFTLALLTENLQDLNQQLVQSPHTAEVYVPIPEEDDRRQYIDWALDERGDLFRTHSGVSPEALAKNSAGLNYTQLRTILADVLENRNRLTPETLSDLKKEFIEAEAYGMLEFIETDNS